MKVLILHNDLRVYWKGRIKYLREFLAAHDISLYAIELFGKGSPYAFDSFDQDNCLFPDNSYNELSKNEIKRKLFSTLDEINPDVIIGGSIVFFSGALGLRWCKKHGRKFIMFDDGKPSDIKRNFIVQYIKDTIIAQVDGLWLPSKDYDAEYKTVFDKPTYFFHGYNTIDNRLFKPQEGWEPDHNTIICVARLVAVKNFNNLLKAWKIVESRNDNYKLLIIGSGPEQDSLYQLKADLDLERVDFAGIVANNDIPTYLHKADAFVLASFAESWGLVVNEAMAAGLPVLLSNKINAAKALLSEGVNGYSFDPVIDLNQPVKKAMSDNSLIIINEMSYENMGRELLTVLNKMNGQPPKESSVMGALFIALWKGGYNTTGWDK
jgi:glycosyltransferase involved in cell wall biosynthesis